jgi:hypothetical protein
LTITTGPAAARARMVAGLRITSARLLHGRLVVRGRVARGARGRLSFTVSANGHRSFRRVTTRGGRFVVSLTAPRDHRRISILARFAGNSSFLPSRVALRIR